MPISWEGVYKEVFAALFKRLGISLTTEFEVGRLARRIDAVAVCRTKERKKLAQLTPFDFFRTHNLIEVKSQRARLSLAEFHRALARGHLYFADQKLEHEDKMLICVITASLPRKLLSLKPDEGGLVQLRQGLYENVKDLKCYVIVVSELDVEERNYPLLLLSKGRKRREYIRALIANREVEYIRYAYLLYPDEIEEELRMSKIKEKYDIQANLRYIVKSVGWEALVRSVGLDETENMMRAVVEQFGPKKAAEMLERVKSDGHSPRRKKRKKSRG